VCFHRRKDGAFIRDSNSKLASSREKDLAFVRVMIEQRLFDQTEFKRLADTLAAPFRDNVLSAFRSLEKE